MPFSLQYQAGERLTSFIISVLTLPVALTFAIPMASASELKSMRPVWGSYGGAGCSGHARIKELESAIGHKQEVTLDFISDLDWKNFESSSYWLVNCHKQQQTKILVLSVPMLTRTGNDGLEMGRQGAYDEHFAKLARTLVRWGFQNAIIRLGWEFNGKWYNWSAIGREDVWKDYWRRIVRTMKATPGAEFKFEWCYSLSDIDTYAVERAYPGDDVVDGVGVDVYNQSWFGLIKSTPDVMWQRILDAPRGLNWARNFALSRAKYVSLPEWGTGYRPDGHGYGDVPEFIEYVVQWSIQNNVKYISYWNYPAPDYRSYIFSTDLVNSRQMFLKQIRRLLEKGN